MEFKINELSLTENEVEVTFAYDEIKDNIAGEVKKQSKNIQIPGFRKGKVPVSILKKMYGDSLEYEASEKVANSRFWELAESEHLHPIGQPHLTDLKFKPGEDFTFKVKYEVMPKLEVKEYTDLVIEVPELTVKDEDVETEIKNILKSNSTNEPADLVGDDNNYIIDVEVTRVDEKGDPYPDTKPEKIQIDLSNDRVQVEIINNSRGKKIGESFHFTFTDKHQVKDEQGNEKEESEIFNYSATINGIKKIIVPELNEELIKKATKDKVSNETDLRAEIRKDLQAYIDQRTDELINDKLLGLIIKNNDFNPPSSLVANILEDLVKRDEESFKKQGYGKYNHEEARKRLKPYAEIDVKWYLIKDAIEKKEEIKIGDEELQKLAEEDAVKTGISVDKLLNYYKSSNYTDRLLDKKLFDFLKEKNTINKVAPEMLSQKKEEQ